MIYETNCLVLTSSSRDRMRKVFRDHWFNETENMYCVPVDQITAKQVKRLKIPGLCKAQYLIAEMHICHHKK